MSKVIGWIHLHRKIQECVIWDNDEKFDCRSAWIDLLLLANHEDKKILFDGKPIIVQKGQRITSIRSLADRWHWSIDKTSRYLKMLESENMITRDSDNRRTLLTIVNYSVYNDLPNTDEDTDKDTDKDTDRTPASTQPEHQSVTNKNDKNDKNEKNDKEDNNPPTPQRGKREKKESCVELFTRMIKESPKVLSDEVISVLHEWMEYKDQKKDKYVEGGMKTLLNQIYKAQKEYGSEAVVNCVRDSMASNYKGIILDKLAKTQMRKATTQEKTNKIIADYAKQIQEEESDEKK